MEVSELLTNLPAWLMPVVYVVWQLIKYRLLDKKEKKMKEKEKETGRLGIPLEDNDERAVKVFCRKCDFALETKVSADNFPKLGNRLFPCVVCNSEEVYYEIDKEKAHEN